MPKVETCRVCGNEVRMMMQRGTGLCSSGCEDREKASQSHVDDAQRVRPPEADAAGSD